MAGATITVTIKDKEVRAAFRRLMKLGANPAPVLKSIGESLLQSTHARFETGRDPQGQPWTPLSRPTQVSRLGGDKAFTKKGKLRTPAKRSLANMKILIRDRQAGLMATIRYQMTGKDSVQVGSDKIYAAVHQFGAVIRPVKAKALAIPGAGGGVRLVQKVTIPARPYLGISSEDRREIASVIQRHVNRALSR